MSRGRKCVVGPGRRAACGRAAGSRANPRRPGHRRPVRAGLGHRGPPRLDAPDTLHRPPLQSTSRPGSRKPADFARPRNMLAIEPSLPHGSEDRNYHIVTAAAPPRGSLPHGSEDRNSAVQLVPSALVSSLPHGSEDRNPDQQSYQAFLGGRSLTGARIETDDHGATSSNSPVAPSRERGSKQRGALAGLEAGGSLPHGSEDRNTNCVASLKGGLVAPSRERGSKRVALGRVVVDQLVAPSRERGSKHELERLQTERYTVVPSRERGSKWAGSRGHSTSVLVDRPWGRCHTRPVYERPWRAGCPG